ncbi:MAG: hypothetical protein R2793_04765 [Flavobacteriaceae bacterium]
MYRILCCLLMVLLLMACSKKEDGNSLSYPPVAVYGFPESTQTAVVTKTLISPQLAVGTTQNLTDAFGFDWGSMQKIYDHAIISWYLFTPNGPFIFKDPIFAQETTLLEGYCDLGEVFVRDPICTPNEVIGAYDQYDAATDTHLLTFGLQAYGEACERLTQPGYFLVDTMAKDGYLLALLGKQDIGYQYKLLKINLATQTVEGTLNLLDQAPLFMKQGDQLYAFDPYTVKVFDFDSFALLSSQPNPIALLQSLQGFLDPPLANGQILLDEPAAQPSPYLSYPLLLDLDTGETLKGGGAYTAELATQLGQVEGYAYPHLGAYAVDVERGWVVFGFTTEYHKRGVVYTNFNAEILDIVELEVIPNMIFIERE